MSGSRIGIFGGSFDPIHVGHLVAAIGARHDLRLDQVLMMVANQPWQKVGTRDISDPELRYQMVAAAVKSHEGLEASRLEIDRGGPSYMVETLQVLRQKEPDAELFLIVGMDTAAGIETWNQWEKVAEIAQLAIVNRPGGNLPSLGSSWKVSEVIIPALEVSSTDLRQRLIDGRPLDFLIPEPALELLNDADCILGR